MEIDLIRDSLYSIAKLRMLNLAMQQWFELWCFASLTWIQNALNCHKLM